MGAISWRSIDILSSLPITLTPATVDSDHFKRIERFTVILFDKLSPLDSINKTRMELFCKNSRDMDKLPPTQITQKLP